MRIWIPAVLIALFFIAQPALSDELENLRLEWGRCIEKAVPRFSKVNEPADIVVEAIFGSCTAEEEAVRQWFLNAGGIFQYMPPEELDAYMAKGRQRLRSELLARILIERSQ